MKLASLFSGGKDSTYAIYLASKTHAIEYLVTIKSQNTESYMFHTANINLTETQAELMGIPVIYKESKGIKEEELKDIESILRELKKKGIEGITTGAVASNYQKTRIEKICKDLGLECISPFWGRNPEEVLREMVSAGFEIVIVAVAAGGLDESWLGRIIDRNCIDELIELNQKLRVHVMGEGGEYETMVLDCPLFRKKIAIEESEKIWHPETRSGGLEIKKLRLVEKN
jgi:diphthine-ammonia ligase